MGQDTNREKGNWDRMQIGRGAIGTGCKKREGKLVQDANREATGRGCHTGRGSKHGGCQTRRGLSRFMPSVALHVGVWVKMICPIINVI